jgi:hypothetical protein
MFKFEMKLSTALVAVIVAAALATAPAAAQTATTSTTTTTTAKPKRALTPGLVAARERMKNCAAECMATKAAGKVEKGMKWPQYWSACNKRLKGAAT